MDIVSLARFQFAMTTVFHFFFVPLSIGMALMTTVFEGLYIKTKDEKYKIQAKFWGKIMLLSFAVGVVTGIIQEFQFGMNWSDYSRFVGDIFGAPLAIEALLAFFMESTFIGLWMFTWDRFKPAVHWLFMILTTLGSVLSAFWILVANSFMQQPGKPGTIWNLYLNGKVQHATTTAQVQQLLHEGAKPQLINFGALFANQEVMWQFIHVLTGAVIFGGMAVAGMAAWRILKKQEVDFFKKAMRVGFTVLLIGAVLSLVAGDRQMNLLMQDNGQPMKAAAMEGAYENVGTPKNDGKTLADFRDSHDSASWSVVAFFNEKEHKTLFSLDVPYVLSLLSYHQPTGAFRGMNTVNKQLLAEYGPDNYYPAVTALFWSFRVMTVSGFVFILLSIIGLFGTTKKREFMIKNKFWLYVTGLCLWLPIVANTAGWLITELGRQPWAVYGLIKVRDSVSPNVSVASLLVTNIVYFLIFAVLGCIMVFLSHHALVGGPQAVVAADKKDEKKIDPFDKGAFGF